jgi:hypothetical protein
LTQNGLWLGKKNWRDSWRHLRYPGYVPALMITHVVAFYLLLRPQSKAVRAFAGDAAAS